MEENAEEYRKTVEKMKNRKEMTDTVEEEWLTIRRILKGAATKVCGMTRGGPNTEKEVWWWNEEVQVALKEKKKAYKSLKDGKGDPESIRDGRKRQKEQWLEQRKLHGQSGMIK